MTGAKHQDSAEKCVQASLLADDMIERMRMNRIAAQAGRYDIGLGRVPGLWAGHLFDDLDRAQRSVPGKRQLRCLLPGGDVAIRRRGNLVIVAIGWDDNYGRFGDRCQSLEIVTRP